MAATESASGRQFECRHLLRMGAEEVGTDVAMCPYVSDAKQLDAVLIVALAALAGAPLFLAPWPTGVAIVSLALGLWRLKRRGLAVSVLLLSLLGAWRVRAELVSVGLRAKQMSERLSGPIRCSLKGTVVRVPVVLRRAATPSPPLGAARVSLQIRTNSCAPDYVPSAALQGLEVRLYGAPEGIGRGDEITALADFAAMRAFSNPGETDPRVRFALLGSQLSGSMIDLEHLAEHDGLLRSIDRARAAVRGRIERTFAPAIAPLARALVLGETNLRANDREAFRRSGLAHLLAVSGTHLVLAVLALAQLLQALLVRVQALAQRVEVSRITAALCLPVCWLYAEFAGGGGSAYRAAAMLSVALLVRVGGRRPNGTRCFACSALMAAVVEPLALYDLSFSLSLAATGGLLVASRPVDAIRRRLGKAPGMLFTALAATLAASLACAPILLTIGPALPLWGVVANVLAAPVGELAALPVCLLHAVVWWWPALEAGAATLGSGALAVVLAVARATGDGEVAMLEIAKPTGWQLAAMAVAAGAWWGCRRPRRKLIVLLSLLVQLVALEELARQEGQALGHLRITVLDVGQGDAIMVDLPDGSLMLVDGGGLVGSETDLAERVLLPVLRWRRRRRIDIVVLSHAHPDHYSGLFTLFERMPIGQLWLSGRAQAHQPGGLLAKALERLVASGTTLRRAARLCQGPLRRGRALIQVLGPCPDFAPDHGPNDNSIVLHLSLGARSALLTGDAEAYLEAQLLASGRASLRADFLKVGHHGSRTSSGRRFVAAVQPGLAAISCGPRNRFGHPHPQTLATLREAGATIARTDRGGAVVWETDGVSASWHRVHGDVP